MVDELRDDKSLPTGTHPGLSKQLIQGLSLHQRMEHTGIAPKNLGRLYQAFTCVGMVGLQQSNEKAAGDVVHVAVDGLMVESQTLTELGDSRSFPAFCQFVGRLQKTIRKYVLSTQGFNRDEMRMRDAR